MELLSIYLSASVIILSCSAKELPSFIKKCKRDYPEINECLIERVDDLRPYLAKGIPEMKLPSIQPLAIPKVEVNTGNNSSGGLRASFTNVVIAGAEKFKVTSTDFDLKDLKIDVSIHIPKLRIGATYSLTGKLLILNLSSTGPVDANITDINATCHCNAAIVTRNGKEYLDVSNNTGGIHYDSPSFYFGNLFNGNEELTKQTNKVLNDNIDELGNEFKPVVARTISSFIITIISNIFDEYSLDELFD